MIDTDKYEGHTENKWEWYEFGDGDLVLCPLFDGVKANEDDMWWVDENGDDIYDSQDIFNWDESILIHLKSDQLPRKRADMNLIADAPLLFAEVKRLRDLVEFAIAGIDSNHYYMGEEAQVDLRDYLMEMIE